MWVIMPPCAVSPYFWIISSAPRRSSSLWDTVPVMIPMWKSASAARAGRANSPQTSKANNTDFNFTKNASLIQFYIGSK